jgi:hypothetical protein
MAAGGVLRQITRPEHGRTGRLTAFAPTCDGGLEATEPTPLPSSAGIKVGAPGPWQPGPTKEEPPLACRRGRSMGLLPGKQVLSHAGRLRRRRRGAPRTSRGAGRLYGSASLEPGVFHACSQLGESQRTERISVHPRTSETRVEQVFAVFPSRRSRVRDPSSALGI